MGFRINTNVSSMAARRTLGNTTANSRDTLRKLSSGYRINKAADDAAGMAISEKMRANIRSTLQADRNANDGISMIQSAEGALSEISSTLIRLRELAIQASTDTVSNKQRLFSNIEFNNLKNEIERVSQVTEFNGRPLLNGKGKFYELQIGIKNDAKLDRIYYDAQRTNASIDKLGLKNVNVKTGKNAQNSLRNLDNAIDIISEQRANLGAIQNRLVSTSSNLKISAENLSDANSRIRDTDFAKQTARNTKLNILMDAGTSVLTQANNNPKMALKLLR